MRCLLCVTVFLLAARPMPAAEQAKPNTLTPQEIADGWLLLFDGETTFGWETQGEVKVADGLLVIGEEKASTVTAASSFHDFELRLEYRFEAGLQKAQLHLKRTAKGAVYDLPVLALGVPVWHESVVRVESNKETAEFRGGIDGRAAYEKKAEAAYGRTTLAFQVPAGDKLALRNVKLRPLGLKSIFNGKDLTGWKESSGGKAKFTVTKEGWLNVQQGPGQLQTEGQWGDFVLQLDCVSNSQHVKSAVFFRCRPGEPQHGYECQVRNHFKDEATQEYTLEEYDPKTNELKDKKKVQYAAVDYGTGGIHGRQPARRRAATDYEWFGMTVIAQGRHVAVWVNGIRVTDWTDHRPLKDDARAGCRLGKGPISLQGHDPTTDVSFRNLRIIELP